MICKTILTLYIYLALYEVTDFQEVRGKSNTLQADVN